jgi:predicted ATP-grasp superfamily ATP-dependent carboligase
MAKGPSVLIAATSGRALAASARRAGYLPLVADCCGDLDTIVDAHRLVHLAGGLDRGLTAEQLVPALEQLSIGHQPVGLVYGSGFDARPDVLRLIGRRWSLLGNDADCVALLKDPIRFAELCAASRVCHPETRLLPPASGDWLCKQKGGTGGTHIRLLQAPESADPAHYFQRRESGDPISVLFLAAGETIEIVGITRQWPTPGSDHPYRYGGATKPAGLSPAQETILTDAIRRLVRKVPLKGLNSADFLVAGTVYVLLEINPRPGATLDIFEPESCLFENHVAACLGALTRPSQHPGARAAAVIYATRPIAALPIRRWPDWTADRQRGGSRLAVGDPLCTVVATGSCPTAARTRLNRQSDEILLWAQGQTQ